jgi:hypothetical protein
MFSIVYQVDRFCAFGNKVLGLGIDNTKRVSISVRSGVGQTLYLIIALCIPVLHVVNWQNAVRAVSGEEILEDVTLDWMFISRRGSSSSAETLGSGKQVS